MKEVKTIETKDDIIELLEDYLKEQYITEYQEIQETSRTHRSGLNDGIVFNKFRSKHKQTIETLNWCVSEDAFRNEIVQVYKRKDSAKETFKDYINSNTNEKDISQITMDDWIKTFYNPYVRNNIDKGCLSDSKYRILLYLYHAFDNYLYSDKYKNRILGLQEKFMGLQTQYGEEQFYEHNLIAVDDTRSLLTVSPTRLYDKRLNRTFLMKNISLPLCRILTGTEGINKLSVRLLDSVGVEGKLTKSRIDEELERGYYFNFDDLGRFPVTKLYSVELYYNCLYITVKDKGITYKEITFEELYDSPESDYNNEIITQVVHCLYVKYNNEYYITHLDHEYIFYTEEEYKERKKDDKKKGHRKMKNFKIDDSKIKLTPQFLYKILACIFRHIELIKEYFQKCIEPSALQD